MEYILGFNGKVNEQTIINANGVILNNYSHLDPFVSVELDEMALGEMILDPSILTISKNQICCSGSGLNGKSNPTSNTWSLMNTSNYYSNSFRGSGVKVAVLDSGLALTSRTYSLNSSKWADCVGNPALLTPYDDHGHGTQVTSLISNRSGYEGSAQDVDLYVAKVLDNNNNGSVDSILAGINWAITQGVDIINFSIFFYSSYTGTELRDALRNAYNNYDILIVGISGNGTDNDGVGVSTLAKPAEDYSVIAVGSINDDLDLLRASFSNYGTGLDIMARGEWIWTINNDNNYTTSYGTSFAAPLVTSHLACLKQKFPTYSKTELKIALYETCYYPSGESGNTWEYGNGICSARPLVEEPDFAYITQTNGYETKVDVNWFDYQIGNTYDIIWSNTTTMPSSPQFTNQANTSYTIEVSTWGNKYFKVRCRYTYNKPDGVSVTIYSNWVDFSPYPINIQAYSSGGAKVNISGIWTIAPCKVYIGGSWVQKPVKIYNPNTSSWETI